MGTCLGCCVSSKSNPEENVPLNTFFKTKNIVDSPNSFWQSDDALMNSKLETFIEQMSTSDEESDQKVNDKYGRLLLEIED